ncbi:hypothetical protein [Streptomyces sp. V3I7]|uniref:hypothetical protein n=1 Tax=Streptomyces sp. V3I7 TaxID=3042278 RepID=UPI00278B5454|nr:hypothetical protein [Streptomyces sp. V3I7]MDQ0994821.1 hypothetical protein [Streptomyces sp. V3I7]
MELTRLPERTEQDGAKITTEEREQAWHALRELLRRVREDWEMEAEPLRVPLAGLNMARPFFELGWAMGVRTGSTPPAVADVPVDHRTVNRAFRRLHDGVAALRRRQEEPEPVMWQRVRYHGSLTSRHGRYWVHGIRAHSDVVGGPAEIRYDLCEVRGTDVVSKVWNCRRESLTPLPEYRTRS